MKINFSPKTVCFGFLIIVSLKLAAQSKDFEYNWDKAEPYTILQDSLKKHDAVIISYEKFILNDATDGGYFYKDQVHYKMQIVTAKGREQNSIIRVAKNVYGRFKGFDARTIKPDGRVVDLNYSDIKRLDFNESEEVGISEYRFAIPGVEVGDEIEVIIGFESDGLPKGEDILIHSDAYILNASLVLKCHKNFFIDLVSYNDMPPPNQSEAGVYRLYKWSLSGVGALNNENYASPKSQLPYVSYMFRATIGGRPMELYKSYMYTYEDKNPYKRDFEEKMMRLCGISNDQSSFVKFKTTYEYLTSHLRLLPELSEQEKSKPIEYFIENGYIDRKRLHVLIRKLFDTYNISYQIALARNRYSGYFDPNFIPPQAITDAFFSFNDDSARAHVLYPGYSHFYYIDELPFYIKATEALLISKPGLDGFMKDLKQVELPLTPYEFNYRLRVSKIRVSDKEDSILFKCKETYSGDLSGTYRDEMIKEGNPSKNKNGTDKEDDSPLMQDYKTDEQNTEFPFTYKCSYFIKKENFFHRMQQPNSYYLYLGELLENILSPVNDGNRLLNYYPLFTYKDINKVILSFDNEIASDNLDKIVKTIENTYAGVKLNVNRINSKLISLEMEYEIKEWVIPSDQIDQLRAINKAVTELSQSQLVFVFK